MENPRLRTVKTRANLFVTCTIHGRPTSCRTIMVITSMALLLNHGRTVIPTAIPTTPFARMEHTIVELHIQVTAVLMHFHQQIQSPLEYLNLSTITTINYLTTHALLLTIILSQSTSNRGLGSPEWNGLQRYGLVKTVPWPHLVLNTLPHKVSHGLRHHRLLIPQESPLPSTFPSQL